jgi:hypothetical protein
MTAAREVAIELRKGEWELALSWFILDTELERRVREAEGAGCRLTLLLTLDGLDDLLGSLAAEARHCEQKGARAVGSSI